MVSEMEDLIKRLEAAEGPDRELDLAIEKATKRCDPMAWLSSKDPECLAWHEVHEFGSTTASQYMEYPLPKYTASLDAALTLVDIGPDYQVSIFLQKDVAQVDIERVIESQDGTNFRPVAFCQLWKPVPLAVCIAALKLDNDQ